MKIAEKYLKNIEIEVYENGFAVLITEKKKLNGKMRTLKHLIIDGSLIKIDGTVSLGDNKYWKINAEYDKEGNQIIVTRRKTK